MKNITRIAVGAAVVVALLSSVPASFAVTRMIVHQPSTTSFFAKELIDDGGGGMVLSSFDNLGVWGGSSYDAFTGDIDKDGFDEMIIYQASTGNFFAKGLTDDGGGGFVLSGFDNLGNWGGSTYDAFMGDVDGDGFDEMVIYQFGTGNLFAKELTSDGGGGQVLSGFDNLGTWSTNYDLFMGDIDGDGRDEMVEYNPATGDVFATELVSDGGGGMKISGFDNLGLWGLNYDLFMGDTDGDGRDEMIAYSPATGDFYAKELISDGGGGMMMSGFDNLGNWGPNFDPSIGNLIPEPATMVILGLGGLLSLRRRRRRL